MEREIVRRINSQEYLDQIVENSNSVEVFKVISGYFIKGSCEAIPERLEVGDWIDYYGHIDSGNELSNLYYGDLPIIENKLKGMKENNIDARIENHVISIIHVSKNAKGKYDSKMTKYSAESFKNLIDRVQKLIINNHLNTVEDIKEYRSKIDSVSEEAKTLDAYIDLYSDHVFTFIILKYDMIVNDQRSSIKEWKVYDWNDEKLRAKYALQSIFQISY